MECLWTYTQQHVPFLYNILIVFSLDFIEYELFLNFVVVVASGFSILGWRERMSCLLSAVCTYFRTVPRKRYIDVELYIRDYGRGHIILTVCPWYVCLCSTRTQVFAYPNVGCQFLWNIYQLRLSIHQEGCSETKQRVKIQKMENPHRLPTPKRLFCCFALPSSLLFIFQSAKQQQHPERACSHEDISHRKLLLASTDGLGRCMDNPYSIIHTAAVATQ